MPAASLRPVIPPGFPAVSVPCQAGFIRRRHAPLALRLAFRDPGTHRHALSAPAIVPHGTPDIRDIAPHIAAGETAGAVDMTAIMTVTGTAEEVTGTATGIRTRPSSIHGSCC